MVQVPFISVSLMEFFIPFPLPLDFVEKLDVNFFGILHDAALGAY